MILQALKEYYDRKAADPDSDIAPEGFEKKGIPFIIVIDRQGRFINLEDTREMSGKKALPKVFLVPRSRPRSGSKSYETTFLLWDNIGYLCSFPENDEKARNQHQSWLASLQTLPPPLGESEAVRAIKSFYENDGLQKLKEHPLWEECTKALSCNMTFRLAGEELPAPCGPEVRKFLSGSIEGRGKTDPGGDDDRVFGRCLVSGEFGEIARVHSDTRINKDSKKLVGFQTNSGYDSYGKEQGYNAPVGVSAEFAYTTALNTLLKSPYRMLVGDAVTVFWSEGKNEEFERNIVAFLNEPPKDDPDANSRALRSLFQAVQSGAYELPEEKNKKFFVLGLAPNSARIAVRIWQAEPLAVIASRIMDHFNDLAIVHGPKEPEILSVFRLLVSVAVQSKSENIPPNLGGEFMRSILQGLPYPHTLLQAALRRVKAEREITYPRAALVKAFLNRLTRSKNPRIKEELKMALDESNNNIGYRLGRLFAVLEKIQERANPGINATIRDRFYGSASSTPVTVFGNLIRLKNHHLAKIDNPGLRIYYEKLITSIIEALPAGTAFPAHLSLADQGRFAVGYYHQVQDFYVKKSDQKEEANKTKED